MSAYPWMLWHSVPTPYMNCWTVIRAKSQTETWPLFIWDAPNISIEDIDRVESNILENREAEFINIWESMTLNQRRALKLIAATGGKNIYSANNLSNLGLVSMLFFGSVSEIPIYLWILLPCFSECLILPDQYLQSKYSGHPIN